MANTTSSLFCELSEDVLRNIIAKKLQQNIMSYELVSGGLFNTTYKINTDQGKHIIMRAGPVNRHLLMYYEHDLMRTETAVYDLMKQLDIPCTNVILCDTSNDLIDRDYMLAEYIDSISLSSATLSDSEKFEIQKSIGSNIYKMHQIHTDGFGRATDVFFKKSHDNWYDYILSEASTLVRDGVKNGAFTEEDYNLITTAVIRHRDLLFSVKENRLCHGDLWDGNILISRNKDSWFLSAVIDVDRAVFGDIDFDLGNPWIISDGFIQGYGITREELDRPEHKIKREIYSMIYYILETVAWYTQYNNKQTSANARLTVLSKADCLLKGYQVL
ncbi:MAG: aminoglycoside phosphotransferase family protein [Eubacteriales bacterium]